MKTTKPYLLLLGLIAVIILSATAILITNHYSLFLPDKPCRTAGMVIKITDGDTIHVLDAANVDHTIRLAGIDAPERGQPYGKAAGRFLSKQINQQTVCVDWHKRDHYGRLVGVIRYKGRDVNLELVKAGYAWHYKKYQREQTPADRVIYADAESEARSDIIGLWSEPNPIQPTDWRKGVRVSKPLVDIGTGSPVENFTCGAKRFCKQMQSCAEACFNFQECGLSRLDGNSDGVPCNRLCGTSCNHEKK